MNNSITIAVDAMGGDGSPKKIVMGVYDHSKKNTNTFYRLFGNKNEAIELRRTQNSTVSFGDNFDHIFTGNSAKFSFSFWFKNGDLANSNASFITKYSGSDCGEDGREFGIRINSSKKIELLYFMSLQNGSYRGYEGHTAVNDTNWHHVVVSYNATINTNNGKDRVQIYLDTIPQNLSLTISQGSSLSYIQDGSAHFGLGRDSFFQKSFDL